MAPRTDPNLYDTGTESRGIDGFGALRARVGDDAGSHRLGAGVWVLPPGEAAYPYHWHYVEEELLVVIDGTPMLRDADGWRRLERGAVVAFPAGERGGHQLVNDGTQDVRFLTVSTSGEPDIVQYPDEGKIGVFERPPGDGKLWKLFPLSAEVSYAEGIVAPTLPAD
jgi:uncharacterized cupin superfamily protein